MKFSLKSQEASLLNILQRNFTDFLRRKDGQFRGLSNVACFLLRSHF